MEAVIYGSVEGADAYFSVRGDELWGNLSTAKKTAALVRASDYIRINYLARYDVPERISVVVPPPPAEYNFGIETGGESLIGYGQANTAYTTLPQGAINQQPFTDTEIMVVVQQNTGGSNYIMVIGLRGDKIAFAQTLDWFIGDEPLGPPTIIQPVAPGTDFHMTQIAWSPFYGEVFAVNGFYNMTAKSKEAGEGEPTFEEAWNPLLEEATYIAAGIEAQKPGFFSKTYTPGQTKILTEVKGIKWTPVGNSHDEYAQVPVSTAIEFLFRGYADKAGPRLGFMVV